MVSHLYGAILCQTGSAYPRHFAFFPESLIAIKSDHIIAIQMDCCNSIFSPFGLKIDLLEQISTFINAPQHQCAIAFCGIEQILGGRRSVGFVGGTCGNRSSQNSGKQKGQYSAPFEQLIHARISTLITYEKSMFSPHPKVSCTRCAKPASSTPSDGKQTVNFRIS